MTCPGPPVRIVARQVACHLVAADAERFADTVAAQDRTLVMLRARLERLDVFPVLLTPERSLVRVQRLECAELSALFELLEYQHQRLVRRHLLQGCH